LLLLVAGCSSLPPSLPTPDADRVASQMMAAVNAAAWEKTGAVRWDFDGRAKHLWDRRRGLARVEWSDVRALLDLQRRIGRAFEEGVEAHGEDAMELLDDAHGKWTNDAFWLNPVVKVFDPGTEREVVTETSTERGLVVRFTSGGRTPGDVYLFWLGIDGTPARWQMWTSNIPFKGMEASWDGWIVLETGARISTKHETFIIDIELHEVAGAFTLAELEPGADPFAELTICGDQPAVCTTF
jgi:hypothetical protein